MSVNLKQYSPRYYDGSYEMDELLSAEDYLFDNYFNLEVEALRNNQFLSTADQNTLFFYEGLIGIVANPAVETIEFRRSRVINRFAIKAPFTMKFLRDRLDSIVGKGKYTVTMDYNGYTLNMESSAVDQQWFEEIIVTINGIKPANIVFRNIPLVSDFVKVNETVQVGKQIWNYRVGTTARASATTPMASIQDLTDVMGADTMTIQAALLDGIADYTADTVTNALINDTTVISAFSTKSGDGSTTNITYMIPESLGIGVVNNIKLRNAANVALTNSPVYFTVIGDVLVKHTIPVREGA